MTVSYGHMITCRDHLCRCAWNTLCKEGVGGGVQNSAPSHIRKKLSGTPQFIQRVLMLIRYVTWSQTVTAVGQLFVHYLHVIESIFACKWMDKYNGEYFIRSLIYYTLLGTLWSLGVKPLTSALISRRILIHLIIATVWWNFEKNRLVNNEYEFKRSFILVCANFTETCSHMVTSGDHWCRCTWSTICKEGGGVK